MSGNNTVFGLGSMPGIKQSFLMLLLSCSLAFNPAAAETQLPGNTTSKQKQLHLDFVTFIEPPYFYDPAQSDKEGLVSVILKALMEKAGIGYEITIMPPKRAELFAQHTPSTCVIPIEKSQEREVFFTWVSPVLISQNGFFSLASAKKINLQSLEDARPYRIGSYLGSSIGDYLSSFSYLVDLATQNDANIYKLQADRIDLWASDILSARYIAKEANVPITQSRLNFFTSLRAIGCHEDVDTKLLDAMRAALQEMYKSGQMKQIVDSFLGKH